MTSKELLDAIIARDWLAALLAFNFLLIRVLKDDSRFPTIPVRLRPWVSVGLGVTAAVLQKVIAGVGWGDAAFTAAVGGFGPILVHVLGIESAAGDRDIPLPKILKAKDEDPPTKPPSSGSNDGVAVGMATLSLICFFIGFCGFALAIVSSCTPAERAGILPVLGPIEAVGAQVANVLGWCEEHLPGDEPTLASKLAAAKKAKDEGDYGYALAVGRELLEELAKRGDVAPANIVAEQVTGAMAAEAIQNFARAISLDKKADAGP